MPLVPRATPFARRQARLIAAAQAKGLSTDALVREALDKMLPKRPA